MFSPRITLIYFALLTTAAAATEFADMEKKQADEAFLKETAGAVSGASDVWKIVKKMDDFAAQESLAEATVETTIETAAETATEIAETAVDAAETATDIIGDATEMFGILFPLNVLSKAVTGKSLAKHASNALEAVGFGEGAAKSVTCAVGASTGNPGFCGPLAGKVVKEVVKEIDKK